MAPRCKSKVTSSSWPPAQDKVNAVSWFDSVSQSTSIRFWKRKWDKVVFCVEWWIVVDFEGHSAQQIEFGKDGGGGGRSFTDGRDGWLSVILELRVLDDCGCWFEDVTVCTVESYREWITDSAWIKRKLKLIFD